MPIQVAGTAAASADYVSLGADITFPAQTPMVMVKITPVADALVEGTETVVVTLVPKSGERGTLQSQPFARAMRDASTRLAAPSLPMASER